MVLEATQKGRNTSLYPLIKFNQIQIRSLIEVINVFVMVGVSGY